MPPESTRAPLTGNGDPIWHAVLEALDEGVTVHDAAGAIVAANPSAERILGLTLTQMRGLDSFDPRWRALTLDGEDFPPEQHPPQAAIRSGRPVHSKVFGIHRGDGTLVWVSANAIPLRDSNARQVTGVVCSFFDVTTRVQAEERLRASDARYRTLFESIDEGFCVIEMLFDDHGRPNDYRFVEVNPAFEQQTGIRNAVGRRMREIVPAHESHWFEIYGRVATTGESARFENVADALGRFYDVYALRVGSATQSRVAVLFRDVTDRHRNEAALRDSEARFRATFDQAAVGIAHIGLDGRWLRVNERYCRIVGYDREELLTKTFQDITYPADLDADLAQVQRLLAGESDNYSMEKRYVRRDGGLVWVNLTVSLVKNAAGGGAYFIAVAEDVTERRQAEAARRMTEFRFQRLVEYSPQSTQLFFPDGRVRQVNRAFVRLFGITLDELKNYNILHDPELVRCGVMPLMQRAFAGEAVTIPPIPYVTDRGEFAGQTRWAGAYVYPVKDDAGQVEEVVLVHDDVTERREAEAALRASEERFAAFMRNSPTASWITDADGRIEYLSETYVRTFALPAGDLIGKSPFDVYPPAFAEQYVATIRAVAESEHVLEAEETAPRPDGSLGEFLVYKFPLRESSGRMRVGGVAIDVTDRKRAQRDREQLLAAEQAARAEAERVGRMKDEFLATLSHELRTPLNAILGWSQILTRVNNVPAELADGLRTIERNARAQAQIIEDLLDMSRIISGKVRLDVQRLDLVALLRGAFDTVRPSAEAKGLSIEDSIVSTVAPVSGDPARLQQVMWNLLTNSVKFTPKGGRVRVRLERIGTNLEMSVSDTGEGIRPEFLPHVFDRFRQADATTTRRHGGLGLGLSIVKQLVELHGGSIRATSAGVGQGATFIVTLPRASDDARAATDAAYSAPAESAFSQPIDFGPSLSGIKVLVVDDEPDARALVRRWLEDRGATVATAESAVEGLGLLQSERPHVLCSDIGMPVEDGYTLIRRVRALPADAGRSTPAIAMTAYARTEDRVKAILAGFQMHLAKPVEPEELIAAIATLTNVTGRRGS